MGLKVLQARPIRLDFRATAWTISQLPNNHVHGMVLGTVLPPTE